MTVQILVTKQVLWRGVTSAAVSILTTCLLSGGLAPASAEPTFRLPFPCGQTWVAHNGGSSAHRADELDFNRGNFPSADEGDTVVASAAGTVVTASNQGHSNGYGNLIKISHGGGWYTYYAHLSTIAVKPGEVVLGGEPIGSVGNTSYRTITPHLHFEIRLGDGYPGNVRPVPGYDYSHGGRQSLTSSNCASRWDAAELCGSGYVVSDAARLGSAGVVVLSWNSSKESNCAVTLKFSTLSSRSHVYAYIQPHGQAKKQDGGRYFGYAGPVTTVSPGCINWGGSIESQRYDSPQEHC